MSTYACPTPGCGRSRPGDRSVCGACTTDLRRAIKDLPWLYEQLLVTASRQDRLGTGGGRATKADERPLPYDERASRTSKQLMITVDRWYMLIKKTGPATPPAGPVCATCTHSSCKYVRAWRPPSNGTIPELAGWLSGHVDGYLRHHPDAPQAAADFFRIRDNAFATINRPPDRLYAGRCASPGCKGDLFALPGGSRIDCSRCDATHDITTRQATMRRHAEDALATASQAAWTITSLGHPISPGRIRTWVNRSRLFSHGQINAHPVYKIAEILALIEETETRRAERVREAQARAERAAARAAKRSATPTR
jgi:hypothetical protein